MMMCQRKKAIEDIFSLECFAPIELGSQNREALFKKMHEAQFGSVSPESLRYIISSASERVFPGCPTNFLAA